MKRSAHILLAILAGILLQVSLLAVGTGPEQAAAAGKLGFRLVDPGAAGVLLDADLPDAPKPYIGGASPQPVLATSAATAVLPRALMVGGMSPRQPSPVAERPLYLTTLRLRL